MSIASIVAQIRTAMYGKDVRENIASGIESINEEVINTTTKQNSLQQIFNSLTINAGNSNSEIVAGRTSNVTGVTSATIGGRLDYADSSLFNIAINVKFFGAKGDGVTDDTASIQNAINYAYNNGYRVVMFPDGIYMVRELLFKSNIKFFGNGDKSIIKSHPNCITWDVATRIDNESNIIVENLTFDGNKGVVVGDEASGVINLKILRSNNIRIKDCKFQNNGYSNISFENNCDSIWISNNKCLNSDVGIIGTGLPSTNIYIDGNYIDGGTSEGISIYALLSEGCFNNVVITNNIVQNKGGGGVGIKVLASDNAIVKGNIVSKCNSGLHLAGKIVNSKEYYVNNTIIEGNIFRDTVNNGMLIVDAIECKINGNISKNAGLYGIQLISSVRCEVINNDFINANTRLDTTESGNSFDKNTSCRIIGNRFIVERDGIKYTNHAIIRGYTSEYSLNNVFENNQCIPDSIPIFYESTVYQTGDIYRNNIGTITTYWSGSTSKRINNNVLTDTLLTTQIISSNWSTIGSSYKDIIIVDSVDSVVPWTVQGISSNTVFVGKILKVLFKKTNIQLISDVNIVLKGGASSFIIPQINTIITFVWDGTKWYTSDISAEDNIGTDIPTSGKFDIGRKIVQKSPIAGGYLGWVTITAGIACNSLWSGGTPYAINDVRYSGTNVYQCTVAGTSGTTAPTHTTGTEIDGTTTWKYIGKLAAFKGYGLIQS